MMVASANFLALISAMITIYTIVSSPSLHNNVPQPKVLQEHFIKVKFRIYQPYINILPTYKIKLVKSK